MDGIAIRTERVTDAVAIHALTEAAFAPMPFASGTEAEIVGALRARGELTRSLVAQLDGAVGTGAGGEIVGHVAFSPVTIDGHPGGWLGLGPVSVRADLQRNGIGRALIEAGLRDLEAAGATGCALIGNPAIFRRLGFTGGTRLRYGDLDPALVQWVSFTGEEPVGELRFAPPLEPGFAFG
ncbi:GNAT family N-acetyltransferase [Agromyces sp. MMS24-K17]|uniref:GNAT family N-acetyltransferase n=1 Tax=Agromyces sp. MMS24-K17 TaxID=3372850 RepID=UPI0037548BE6